MGKPETRRLSKPAMPWQEPKPAPAPAAKPKTARLPAGKTTRVRRSEDGEEAGPSPAVIAARAREDSRNQMVLIGSIAGGVVLLLIVLVAAMSSGSGQASASERRKPKPVVVEAPPPPPPKPKAHNFVRNTGSIVFVCGGSDAHQDKEVVVGGCPSCPERNQFEVAQDAGGYRCVKCKNVVAYADLKCDSCGKTPRVTHLKKVLPTQRP